MEFHILNNEILNENGSAVAVFINNEIAEKFMNAFNKSIMSESTLKSKIESELQELKQSFKDFNDYLDKGGVISKKSIVHFGIKSLIK